mmetsp:Transcript_40027/g.64216  ORF Transcript_40027/g.64216 Transcript_40027/m.64216 type:complete len:276 (+) Transcript_40027:456-1283(+)
MRRADEPPQLHIEIEVQRAHHHVRDLDVDGASRHGHLTQGRGDAVKATEPELHVSKLIFCLILPHLPRHRKVALEPIEGVGKILLTSRRRQSFDDRGTANDAAIEGVAIRVHRCTIGGGRHRNRHLTRVVWEARTLGCFTKVSPQFLMMGSIAVVIDVIRSIPLATRYHNNPYATTTANEIALLAERVNTWRLTAVIPSRKHHLTRQPGNGRKPFLSVAVKLSHIFLSPPLRLEGILLDLQSPTFHVANQLVWCPVIFCTLLLAVSGYFALPAIP